MVKIGQTPPVPQFGAVPQDSWESVAIEHRGSIWRMLKNAGHEPTDDLIAAVLAANPHITDPRRIAVGTEVWLPRAEAIDAHREQWDAAIAAIGEDTRAVVRDDREINARARVRSGETQGQRVAAVLEQPQGAARPGATRDSDLTGSPSARRDHGVAHDTGTLGRPDRDSTAVNRTPDVDPRTGLPVDRRTVIGNTPGAVQPGPGPQPLPPPPAPGPLESVDAVRARAQGRIDALVRELLSELRPQAARAGRTASVPGVKNEKVHDLLAELMGRFDHAQVHDRYAALAKDLPGDRAAPADAPADLLAQDIRRRLEGRDELRALEYVFSGDGRVSKGMELFFAANGWTDRVVGGAGTAEHSFDAALADVHAGNRQAINDVLFTRITTDVGFWRRPMTSAIPNAQAPRDGTLKKCPADQDPLAELIRREYSGVEAEWRVARTKLPEGTDVAHAEAAFRLGSLDGEDFLKALEGRTPAEIESIKQIYPQLHGSGSSLDARAKKALGKAELDRYGAAAKGLRGNRDASLAYAVATLKQPRVELDTIDRVLTNVLRPASSGGPTWDDVKAAEPSLAKALAATSLDPAARSTKLSRLVVAKGFHPEEPRGVATRILASTDRDEIVKLLAGRNVGELREIDSAARAQRGVGAQAVPGPLFEHVTKQCGEWLDARRQIPTHAAAIVGGLSKRYTDALYHGTGGLTPAARFFYAAEKRGVMLADPDTQGLVDIVGRMDKSGLERMQKDVLKIAKGAGGTAAHASFAAYLDDKLSTSEKERVQRAMERPDLKTTAATQKSADALAASITAELERGLAPLFDTFGLERGALRERLREFKVTMKSVMDDVRDRAAASGNAEEPLTDAEAKRLATAVDRLLPQREARATDDQAVADQTKTAAIMVGSLVLPGLGAMALAGAGARGVAMASAMTATPRAALATRAAGGVAGAYAAEAAVGGDPRTAGFWLRPAGRGSVEGAAYAAFVPGGGAAVAATLPFLPRVGAFLAAEGGSATLAAARQAATWSIAGAAQGAARGGEKLAYEQSFAGLEEALVGTAGNAVLGGAAGASFAVITASSGSILAGAAWAMDKAQNAAAAGVGAMKAGSEKAMAAAGAAAQNIGASSKGLAESTREALRGWAEKLGSLNREAAIADVPPTRVMEMLRALGGNEALGLSEEGKRVVGRFVQERAAELAKAKLPPGDAHRLAALTQVRDLALLASASGQKIEGELLDSFVHALTELGVRGLPAANASAAQKIAGLKEALGALGAPSHLPLADQVAAGAYLHSRALLGKQGGAAVRIAGPAAKSLEATRGTPGSINADTWHGLERLLKGGARGDLPNDMSSLIALRQELLRVKDEADDLLKAYREALREPGKPLAAPGTTGGQLKRIAANTVAEVDEKLLAQARVLVDSVAAARANVENLHVAPLFARLESADKALRVLAQARNEAGKKAHRELKRAIDKTSEQLDQRLERSLAARAQAATTPAEHEAAAAAAADAHKELVASGVAQRLPRTAAAAKTQAGASLERAQIAHLEREVGAIQRADADLNGGQLRLALTAAQRLDRTIANAPAAPGSPLAAAHDRARAAIADLDARAEQSVRDYLRLAQAPGGHGDEFIASRFTYARNTIEEQGAGALMPRTMRALPARVTDDVDLDFLGGAVAGGPRPTLAAVFGDARDSAPTGSWNDLYRFFGSELPSSHEGLVAAQRGVAALKRDIDKIAAEAKEAARSGQGGGTVPPLSPTPGQMKRAAARAAERIERALDDASSRLGDDLVAVRLGAGTAPVATGGTARALPTDQARAAAIREEIDALKTLPPGRRDGDLAEPLKHVAALQRLVNSSRPAAGGPLAAAHRDAERALAAFDVDLERVVTNSQYLAGGQGDAYALKQYADRLDAFREAVRKAGVESGLPRATARLWPAEGH